MAGVTDIPVLHLQQNKNASVRLLDDLYRQTQQCMYTDFIIKVSGQQIHCHRSILAAASPYFNNLCSTDMKEARAREVELQEFQYSDILHVVKFIYNQPDSIPYADIWSYFKVFNYFQLNNLDKIFTHYVLEYMSPANCITCCTMGKLYNLSKVRTKAWAIIHKQFQAVTQHAKFLELSQAEVIAMITTDPEQYGCDDVLQGCVQWIIAQSGQQHTLSSFLPHVDLTKCSLNYLVDLLAAYEHEPFMDDNSYITLSKSVVARSRVKNKMLVISGLTAGFQASNECKRINLGTGEIDVMTTIPKIKSHFSVCRTAHGFVVIGDDASSVICMLYNVDTNTWSELSTPPGDGSRSTSIVCVQSTLYLLGIQGADDSDMYSLTMQPPNIDGWMECEEMDELVESPIIAVIGACIYAVWNTEKKKYPDEKSLSLQLYDTTDDTWSPRGGLPREVRNTEGASAVATSKHMYLVGGGGHLALRYCPDSDQWSHFTRPVSLHSHGAACIVNDSIILCGGLQGPTVVSDAVECYNSLHDTWQVKTIKLPTPLWDHFICAA